MNPYSNMCSSTEILKLSFLFLILNLLEDLSAAVDYRYEACAPKMCGNFNVSYPFYIRGQQESYCGYPDFSINCSDSSSPLIHVPANDYVVDGICYENRTLRVHSAAVTNITNCLPRIGNISEFAPFLRVAKASNLHLLTNCTETLPEVLWKYRKYPCDVRDRNSWGLAMFGGDENLNIALEEYCKTNVVTTVEGGGKVGVGVEDYGGLLRRGFALNWTVSDCSDCEKSGGRCGFNATTLLLICFCPDRPHRVSCKPRKKNLGIILGSAGAAVILVVLAFLLLWRRMKGINGRYFLSRNLSKQPSKLDFEEGSVYSGVSVFTYSELREATKNFDASNELGDGGFGTVYHGKLRDGRDVAVKRLYEHNIKRMEQFKNEIEILTHVRHPNLVTLYGCTSRRSRELLLVYEYIPNGTVADHLHGDKAENKYLTWAHRMNIAIETAEALAYLHATDIIHRDVKTTNILLDHNFCVKVADFGLSRLFPTDVTHVSTAPQGTPGYVDPEYHQCYHLTDKSDVYSFGVVLVELISSMPAVDISRHRHEINLANLAINRIQRCAFDELIDPSLGYKSDAEVMRMTTSVAELAFQCLQGEKELRPTMEEVLETLREIHNFKETTLIENTDDDKEKADETRNNPSLTFSPESEDRVLLKNVKCPSSPNSVTHMWMSSSTSASTNTC